MKSYTVRVCDAIINLRNTVEDFNGGMNIVKLQSIQAGIEKAIKELEPMVDKRSIEIRKFILDNELDAK